MIYGVETGDQKMEAPEYKSTFVHILKLSVFPLACLP